MAGLLGKRGSWYGVRLNASHFFGCSWASAQEQNFEYLYTLGEKKFKTFFHKPLDKIPQM